MYDLYTKKCQKRGREVGEGKKAKGSRGVGFDGQGAISPYILADVEAKPSPFKNLE